MYVRQLKLENIKNFRDQVFDFTNEDEGGKLEGLHVLVGGNASGKTTVLRAVALAGGGQDHVIPLMNFDLGNWLTDGQDQAEIKTTILLNESGPNWPVEQAMTLEWSIRWNTNDVYPYDTSHDPPGIIVHNVLLLAKAILFGYGPQRRLTGTSEAAAMLAGMSSKTSDLLTLFREDAAIQEADEWLKNQQFRALEEENRTRPGKQATDTVRDVKNFLNSGLLPSGIGITNITSDGVMTRDPRGTIVPMRDLSDGCRSVYALVLDMIMRLIKAYGSEGLFEKTASTLPEDEGRDILAVMKPGVVLIDELESHLHPAWQRKFCGWLKSRFPKMQFIVTTHSPLVVQEATGTIYVLPLPGEERPVRKLVGEERRKILLGDAEKVLLGSAFGLQDSRSQWAQRQLEKFSRLNAKKKAMGRLPAAEEENYERLRKDVFLAFDNHPFLLEPTDEAASG